MSEFDYRIVERAEMPPGKCLLSGDIDGPFLDTRTYASEIDPYIYIHVPVAEKIGRSVGMVSGQKYENAQEKIAALTAEVERLTAENDEMSKALDAIEWIKTSKRVKESVNGVE